MENLQTNLISTVVLIGIIVSIVLYKKQKERNASWTGKIVRKQDLTDEDDENHVYRLIFETTDGKKKKITVSEELYNKAKVGEQYTKASGSDTPKKIS